MTQQKQGILTSRNFASAILDCLFIFYLVNRIYHSEDAMFPAKAFDENDPPEITWHISNAVMVTIMMFRVLNNMKVFKQLGHVILMVQGCAQDLIPFVIVFFSWILYTVSIFQLLGSHYSDSEYKGDTDQTRKGRVMMGTLAVDFIQTFRNAVGDIIAPSYKIWEDYYEATYNWQAYFIIIVIWIFWLANQFLMQIVLLNFLIAMINQQYDKQLMRETRDQYTNKSRLNQECLQVLQFFSQLEDISTQVIYAHAEGEATGDSDEAKKGLVGSITELVKKELAGVETRLTNLVKADRQEQVEIQKQTLLQYQIMSEFTKKIQSEMRNNRP